MRIIAGVLGGRTFVSPHSHKTHPMSDKVRGALFNILGDITGLTVLDAYAGSGALSYESISRGAQYVVAIDSDRDAYKVCEENRSNLRIDSEKFRIVQANCQTWIKHHPDTYFDIIFADPPYDEVSKHTSIFNLMSNLKKDGIIVVSLPPKSEAAMKYAVDSEDIKEVSRHNYGDAELVFYRLIA